MAVDEDLAVLDSKVKQLKLEYEQYFLGSRPREPAMLRAEVQKIVALYMNTPIQNTASRFRFNTLCGRFFTLKRQWDAVMRQIEDGTYVRHVFKAKLHQRERSAVQPPASPARSAPPAQAPPADLFESYVAACRTCGQDTASLTRERLDAVIRRQEEALRQQYACTEVRFRVVVEQGKAKLKATPVGAARGIPQA
jgi:hypothetical protein